MWSILLVLALILRPLLKLVVIVLVLGLLLSVIQIAVAIPVIAWEQFSGSEVPEAAYQGLCVVLFVNLLVLYVRRRRKAR